MSKHPNRVEIQALQNAIDVLCSLKNTGMTVRVLSRMRGDLESGHLIDTRDPEALARAGLVRDAGWIEGPYVPQDIEGKICWKWFGGGNALTQPKPDVIPRGFSRDPHHCGGVWFKLLDVPAPPTDGTQGIDQ